MPRYSGPLLTQAVSRSMLAARDAGASSWTGSLDLGRSREEAVLAPEAWEWRGRRYPWPDRVKERTIYWWDGAAFEAVSRYHGCLIKLVPTEWDVPTFEIDGIKMLPTSRESPLDDARRKVALVAPAGKRILDTCGGLGYFAACCLDADAASIQSFEKNGDVLWLRSVNPWSPDPGASGGRLRLDQADVAQAIEAMPAASVDAVLHDPPRFGIAGELYAQTFYAQLARVLRRGGRLFHYTGAPNRLTAGRDVPREVAARLTKAGFKAEPALDGVFAILR